MRASVGRAAAATLPPTGARRRSRSLDEVRLNVSMQGAKPCPGPRNRTGWHSAGRDSAVARLGRRVRTHARSSNRGARPLAVHSKSPCASVAHAGHMKRENPHGDSWNLPQTSPQKALRKSQGPADSWRAGENRECRAGSLPRRMRL